MSTEVEIRFCTEPRTDRCPLATLRRMVDVIVDPTTVDRVFRGLRVVASGSLQPVFRIKALLSAEDLLEEAARWNQPTYALSTGCVLPLPGTQTVDEQPTPLPIRLESLGSGILGRTGEWWIEGDARLSMSALPFVAATSDSGVPEPRPGLEGDVLTLRRFIEAIRESLGAVAFRSFTDAGEFYPFNAHTMYYADASYVARDVDLLRRLFDDGDAALGIPPLGGVEGDLAAFVFHLWRPRDQREETRSRLSAALKRRNERMPLDLRRVARFLEAAGEPGLWATADPKYPFNYFLGEFFVDLLTPQP